MKQHNKNNPKLVSNRLPVAVEDLATVFATELVRYCDSQAHLTIRGSSALARTRWRIDDRMQVVNMARNELGVTVFQVAEGLF